MFDDEVSSKLRALIPLMARKSSWTICDFTSHVNLELFYTNYLDAICC